MRTIDVSTDVFAAIWAYRRPGEDSEDEILRRILTDGGPVSNKLAPTSLDTGSGFYDVRNDVKFPEGFEIFRTYKGNSFTAVASGGYWIRQDANKRFSSLNALTFSVSGKNENAWITWWYRSHEGPRKITDLRPSGSLKRKDGVVGEREMTGLTEPVSSTTWLSDVVHALHELGGKGHLDEIYDVAVNHRQTRGVRIPPSSEAIIRREIENHSSDSQSFLGKEDLFYSVDGIGSGYWGLRTK